MQGETNVQIVMRNVPQPSTLRKVLQAAYRLRYIEDVVLKISFIVQDVSELTAEDKGAEVWT